jgi:general secretion pathway protein J
MKFPAVLRSPPTRSLSVCGFTLIELLASLLILSLLALMSYRGLGAVLDARAIVVQETATWRRLAAFCVRFEQDVRLAAPRPARGASGSAPEWVGRTAAAPAGPRLEFSRFASAEDLDLPRRVGYGLNERQEIELWLWPGADMPADAVPARYAMLGGVTKFDFEYLNTDLVWVGAWPAPPRDVAIPRAVRLRIALASGAEIVRVFALNS